MDDDIDCDQKDMEFVDDDGRPDSFQDSKVIITYTHEEKESHFYKIDTFDYNMMFMEVNSHKRKIAPGKYDDTVVTNSMTRNGKKKNYDHGKWISIDEEEEEHHEEENEKVLPQSLLQNQIPSASEEL